MSVHLLEVLDFVTHGLVIKDGVHFRDSLFSREYEIYEFKISLFTFANNQRNHHNHPEFFCPNLKNLTNDLHGQLNK